MRSRSYFYCGFVTTLNIVLNALTWQKYLWLEGRVTSGGFFHNWAHRFSYKPQKYALPAEQKLVQVEEKSRGRDLIKQVRLELIEHGRPLLEAVIQEILGVKVVSLHTDISTTTGESILLFTLDGEPEYSRSQAEG